MAKQIKPWVPTDATFDARLGMIRQRMGWNIKEAATACSLPHTSWRDWELHGRMPRDIIDAASKIASRTGCDLGWLIGFPRANGMRKK